MLLTGSLESKIDDELEPADGPEDNDVSLERFMPLSEDVSWVALKETIRNSLKWTQYNNDSAAMSAPTEKSS